MNTQDLALREIGILALVTIVLIVAVFVIFRVVRSSLNKRNQLPPGMSVTDLKQLEKRHLLTPEELKRVREAMARQYLEHEKEQAEANVSGGAGSGLEMLAREAERLEREKIRARQEEHKQPSVQHEELQSGPSTTEIPPESEFEPDSNLPEGPPPDEAFSQATTRSGDQLPDHLSHLVGRSRADLEDLNLAGFLEREDLERILRARGEEP